MWNKAASIWALATLLVGGGPVLAEPDDLQQAWLDRMSISQRWDNVEGEPVYVHGVQPVYQHAAGLHLARLEPGDSVTLRIPDGESVRARSPQKLLSAADLDFSWSNGSGLYLRTATKVRGNGESLIGSAPSQGQTLLRVTRPAPSDSPLEVALFVSRRLKGLVTARYSDLLQPLRSGERVRLLDNRSMTDYWASDRHQPLAVDVEGPLRIEVRTRLMMPQGSDSVESYRAYAYLDDALWRVLSFETALETRRVRALARCIGPIGRIAAAYIDVPEGKHRLQLRFRRPTYARLVAGQRPDDYRFDGNRPDGYRQIAEIAPDIKPELGFWNETQPRAVEKARQPRSANSLAYREALQVAEDNAYRDGGLAAAMALQSGWPGSAGHPSHHNMVSRRLGLHTSYKHLMPDGGGGETVYAWFQTSRLREVPQPAVILPESHARTLLQDLPGGYFSRISPGLGGRLRYSLPERSVSSQLRLAVERSRDAVGAVIYVRFDEDEAFELRVREPVLPDASAVLPLKPLTALALLQGRHQARGDTLSGPFAAQRRTAPLTTVGTLEFPLPAAVRSVTVWQSAAAPGTRVALAYRAGKTFKRSESDLTSLLEALGEAETYRVFSTALSSLKSSPGKRKVDADRRGDGNDQRNADLVADLRSQWQPLLRSLRNKYLQFSAAVGSPPVAGESPVLPSQRFEALRADATKASAEGDWHRVLEIWSRIWRGSRGKLRGFARLQQAAALRQLGNAYLSERLQREVLLYAQSEGLRKESFAMLWEARERSQDRDGALTLLTVMAVLDPQPGHILDLAKAFLEADQSRNALLTLLALPGSERAPEFTLQASYLQGWWQVFDQALGKLTIESERLRWRGYRSQLKGDYAAALDYWGQMGRLGEGLHRQLVLGLRIRADLDSIDFATRRRALQRWQDWQAVELASGRYSGKPSAVKRSQGAVLIRGIHHSELLTAYRADFAKPLIVPIYGPTRVRLTVRPLHASAANPEPINDWIGVWRGLEKETFPIVDNRSSPKLSVVGQPGLGVGRGIDFEYPVPPGYHEIRVEPERGSVAIELKMLRPALPLAILPPLTTYTAREALAAGLGTRPPPSSQSGDLPRVLETSSRCLQTRLLELPPDGHGSHSGGAISSIELPSDNWFETQGNPIGAATEVEQAGISGTQPAMRVERAEELRLRALRKWLWLAEHDPSKRKLALAEAERAFADNPTTPGAEQLMRRLRRDVAWQRVTTIQQSAGVRAIEPATWEPEHPALRIRKALMQSLKPGEQIVSGFDTLVMAVENTQRTRFMLDLESVDLEHPQSHGMLVFVAIDEQPEQQVNLVAEKPKVVLIEELGKGHHSLRIRIAHPVSNQYLRVRVWESRGETQETVSGRSQRFYDLATPDEPLVAHLDGPAWIRIDEYREDSTRVSYRMVESGSQLLELAPPAGELESLYRIYRQTPVEERPKPAIRPAVVAFEAMESPPLQLPGSPLPEALPPASTLPLGGQEDGTWSAFTALVARRALNDEPDAGLGTDRFFATGLGYRYFSERQETYYESSFNIRWRDSGEPTLAFQQWVDIRRNDWPFDLDLAGSLFVQDSEAAATLKGRVSRQWRWGEKTSNRPSIAFFQRFLTLDDVSSDDSDKVDQDIFTTYKHNHKRALQLGNLTVHRPSADSMVHARIGVSSNEDLNMFDPDSVQLRLGSKQLFGDFTVGTGYSLTHYFADSDRERSSNRSKFWLDLGYLGFWSPRDGAEATFRIQYDAKAEDTSFWLAFGWNRSNGRYFRDFRPSDVDFIAQRNLRALEKESAPAVLNSLDSM